MNHTLKYFKTMSKVEETMTFRKAQVRVHATRKDENFEYEGGTFDENREVFGEEFEHSDTCDFIYGNCNCGLENEGHEDIWL